MKSLKLCSMIGGWIFVLLAGCQKPEPQMPELIAPPDGVAFDTIPPTLIWSASNPEGKYLVKLNVSEGASDTNLVNVVDDTTYTPSIAGLEYATIKWCVGVEVDTGTLWSKVRTFYVDTRKNVPKLIFPDVGEVFDSLPPAFVWHKEDVSEYYLMAFKDSLWSADTLVYDTLTDTTFTLSTSDFSSADSGTYKWTVAVSDTASGELLYPSPRSFKIKIKGTPPSPIDLDTTYFPFGLGYEWCYERRDYGRSSENMPDWDNTYNFVIKVVDSLWRKDTLVFTLQGGEFRTVVGKFVDGRALLYCDLGWWGGQPEGSISVTPPYDLITSSIGLSSAIREDTLSIAAVCDRFRRSSKTILPREGLELFETRVKEIGTISQNHTAWGSYYNDSHFDRLLYFYNGKDTIYKSKDWETINIDLDTTYFPLGLENQWTYQRHITSVENGDTGNIYDTFTVSVSDSSYQGQIVLLNFASDSLKPFMDLGNPASYSNGRILIQVWNNNFKRWINPSNPEEISDISFSIRYYADSLILSYAWCPTPDYYNSCWTKRIRGIGIVIQYSHLDNIYNPSQVTTITDSLLRYTTPQGQRYP